MIIIYDYNIYVIIPYIMTIVWMLIIAKFCCLLIMLMMIVIKPIYHLCMTIVMCLQKKHKHYSFISTSSLQLPGR